MARLLKQSQEKVLGGNVIITQFSGLTFGLVKYLAQLVGCKWFTTGNLRQVRQFALHQLRKKSGSISNFCSSDGTIPSRC